MLNLSTGASNVKKTMQIPMTWMNGKIKKMCCLFHPLSNKRVNQRERVSVFHEHHLGFEYVYGLYFFQAHIWAAKHLPCACRDIRGHNWWVEGRRIAPPIPWIYCFSPKSIGVGKATRNPKFLWDMTGQQVKYWVDQKVCSGLSIKMLQKILNASFGQPNVTV